MSIVVTGSVAFDNIMNFPGRFKDHILPEKIHVLSVAFQVDTLKKQHGGTAANIAYNLALHGERPKILATAGNDFAEYGEWLEFRGVDISSIQVIPDEYTATAFITTDLDDNQIIGFHPGAMREAGKLSLHAIPSDIDLVIIAPDDPLAMARYPGECRERGIPFIFCPGQQTVALSEEQLLNGVTGARCVVGNDYEMELIASKTGADIDRLTELAEVVITTLADCGSSIATAEGTIEVPIAPSTVVNDPTGAGDAYLAGLAIGMLRGEPPARYGRIAALTATHAVEFHGTQQHVFDAASFSERYRAAFHEDL